MANASSNHERGKRPIRAWVLASVVVSCVACEPALEGGERDASAMDSYVRDASVADGASPAPAPFRPDLVLNRWERVREDLPSPTWETDIAYDPRVGALVQQGGHLPSSYVQTSYAWRYHVREDSLREVLAPIRPMRRCIVELAWLGGPERVASVQGAASHGSLPQGSLRGWRVTRSDARGPWLYDAQSETWEHARPTGVEWPQRSHAGIAYDETGDALYVVGGDALYAYVAHANQILRLPMPAVLRGRQGYGIAFDPRTRRLAIFGGSSRHWTYGHIDGDETDNCDVVDAETCASYYRAYVLSDTWVLDVDEAAAAGWPEASEGEVPLGWHEVAGAHPARGMPMWNHQRLQLTWHPPSGRSLLLQHPIDDAPNTDPRTWPPVEMWAFDAAALSWSRIETQDAPHFGGVAAYASEEDVLFAWGGGERGEGTAADRTATSSRVLYMIRPDVGERASAPIGPSRLSARALDSSRVELRFAARAGITYEIQRALAAPMPGSYETLARVVADSAELRFIDTDAATQSHAYRVRAETDAQFSLPAFDRPARARDVVALALSPREVELRWAPPGEAVVEVRVHRFGPGESRHVIGTLVAGETRFIDSEIDLSDGLSRVYLVTFVDQAGRESGYSPMAYTAPDPPAALRVEDVGGGEFEVRWTPRDPRERLELYYLDYHCNARASIESFLDAFTRVEGGPFEGGSARVRAPALDPTVRNRAPESEPGECGRTLAVGHYFYARVVDPVGTLGLYSDITSPEDPRFRAALPAER